MDDTPFDSHMDHFLKLIETNPEKPDWVTIYNELLRQKGEYLRNRQAGLLDAQREANAFHLTQQRLAYDANILMNQQQTQRLQAYLGVLPAVLPQIPTDARSAYIASHPYLCAPAGYYNL